MGINFGHLVEFFPGKCIVSELPIVFGWHVWLIIASYNDLC